MAGYHLRSSTGGEDGNPSAAGYLEMGTDKQAIRPLRLNSDGTISLGDGTAVPDTTLARSGVGVLTVNGATVPTGSAPLPPRRVVLTDAATLTPNADVTDIVEVTLGGNRTVAPPTGTPTEGQRLIFKVIQDGTGSRTLTWSAAAGGYAFSGGTAPTLSSTAARTDYVQFLYHAAGTVWRGVATALNFS